ncbi:MAG: hypothetical protein K0R98_2024 [Rickettsiaceae bacterium]|jgi:hypothetical protein|nr:hypothetical protein [Rickettsiaceae bacterium]
MKWYTLATKIFELMEAVMGKSVLENVNKALKDVADKKPKDQVKALEEAAKAISKAGKDASLDQAYQSFTAAHKASGQPKLDKKYAEVVAEGAKREQAATAQATPVSKKSSDSSISKSASTSSDSPERRDSAESKVAAPLDADAAKAKAKAEALARIKAGNQKIRQLDANIERRNEEIRQADYRIADLNGQIAEKRYAALSQKFDRALNEFDNNQQKIDSILNGGKQSFAAQAGKANVRQ